MAYKPEAPELYQGNQVLINSDRLFFNAKTDGILLFSDKVIGFSTNGSFHFDTSKNTDNKFIVNSPNIHLGLKDNNEPPTEPAVLGHELETFLEDILDIINNLIDDIKYKVSYTSGPPGSPTEMNPLNESALSARKTEIRIVRDNIANIMSKKIKLV